MVEQNGGRHGFRPGHGGNDAIDARRALVDDSDDWPDSATIPELFVERRVW